MMKKLLLLFSVFCTIPMLNAQSTLFKGDIAIIGINTQPSFPNDDFTFVTFEDLEPGTQIYFTDVPADGDLTIATNVEGHILYTAPTSGVTAGTVIGYQNNIADFTTAAGTFSLSNNGDNITAYQGTSVGNVTRYLHAVSDGSGSAGTFPTGFNALLKLFDDDGQYIGTRLGGVASIYFKEINKLSNWTVTNAGITSFNFTPFEFTTDPIVLVDPSNLSEFQYYENNGPSTEQSFQLLGQNLTTDITLTVSDYFEISTSADSGYSTSLNITPNVNGRIVEMPIYVRLSDGLAADSYNATIAISSPDLSSNVTITLQGEVNDRPDLLITGVFYEDSPGNSPEATGLELYAINDIPDLSVFGVGSINDPNVSDGQEFTFPNVSASEGDYIYIAADESGFTSFFEFSPDYVDQVAEIEGGDTILLFAFGDVIDTFGNSSIDGVGTSWDYTNSWAARVSDSGPDGDTFIEAHWTFGGVDAFDGARTNLAAAPPFPLGRYLINWRGRTSSDWNDGSNWSSMAVPTAADNIKITPKPNQPVITTDVAVNQVSLKDILTIATGSLTANGDVESSNGTINIASGASLITLGSINGTTHTYTRNTTFDTSTGQYSVIGAPVSGANTSLLGYPVYGYDETAPFGVDGTGRYFWATNVPMEVGDAFFSAYTGTVVFTGNFNTGTILEPLVYDDSEGTDVAGYNLVSNPYPSAIETLAFLDANTAVMNRALYIWDDDNPAGTQGNNDDYLIVNELGAVGGSNGNSYNGYIGTAQGFFVKATVAGQLEFNNSMRVIDNNSDSSFFRTRNENSSSATATELDVQKIKLALTRPDNGLYNSIIVGFLDEATEGRDTRFDADKLSGNFNLQFYSYLEENPLAIQGLPRLTEDRVVPLGMIIGKSGEYQINVEELLDFPEDVSIFIHDKNTDVYNEIGLENPFTFNSEAVFDQNRFDLVLRSDSTLNLDDNTLSENKLVIIASEDKLTLQLIEGFTLPSAKIEVTDILGRTITNKNINEQFNSVDINHNFADQNVYLVKVKSELGTVVKKILIK